MSKMNNARMHAHIFAAVLHCLSMSICHTNCVDKVKTEAQFMHDN